MKYIFCLTTLLILALSGFAQTGDVINITKSDLELKYLQTGNSTYLVYFKRTVDGPAERMALVKTNVEPATIEGRKAFRIKQQWDMDNATVHGSETLHDAADFSTLRHEYWWKIKDSRDMSAKFDFLSRTASVDGKIDDKAKAQMIVDFEKSFESYNLCWHSDLTIFPLLPFRNGRTFKINFYDPGAAAAKIAEYHVTGSEPLVRSDGKSVDCWVMEHRSTGPTGAVFLQRFWISKASREILKEEDSYPGGFRYKLKLAVSGEK